MTNSGVDVWEVIDAAATKPFGFMKFTPGPGIGGHCIPLDPHYLAWKMRTLNYKTRFIDLASEINSQMPDYVVEKVASRLNDESKSVRGSRILVLGVAYKRDIDDVRESPALDVIRLLEERGAHVEYHDPFVSEIPRRRSHPAHGVSSPTRCCAGPMRVSWSPITSRYRGSVWSTHAGLVVDTRNVCAGLNPGRARIVALASGHAA